MLERALGGATRLASATAARLPLDARRRAGAALGTAARALGVRRATVLSQLRASFPGRDEAWVRGTAAGCYRHFGEEIATLAGGASAREAVLGRVRGVESFRADYRSVAPGAAVVVSAHHGNWEVLGALLAAADLEPLAVARRQRGAWNAPLASIRRAGDVEIAYRGGNPSLLAGALERGRCVYLVADQHVSRGGTRLPFLGRPAWVTLGPARLSIATGVPLLFATLEREGDGYLPRVAVVRAGGLPDAESVPGPEGERDAKRAAEASGLTAGWIRLLEVAIRRRPEQYFWFHRRWKERRPERAPAGGGRNVTPSAGTVEA